MYKKKEIYEANVMLYEIRIRQFNDEYLCVQALLTKRGETKYIHDFQKRKQGLHIYSVKCTYIVDGVRLSG